MKKTIVWVEKSMQIKLKTYREVSLNNRHNWQTNSVKSIKKIFRKEKEVSKKKKITFEPQTGFQTIQYSEC